MVWNLHALRGAVCLVVVWYHLMPAAESFGLLNPVFHAVRWVGPGVVDIFFVLSGFIMAYTNATHVGCAGAVPGYLFRRFWRVYPTYWAAMAFSAIMFAWLVDAPIFARERAGDWPYWLALAPSSPWNVIITPAWSLMYEVMYYAMFGAVLALPQRWGNALIAAWAVATIGINVVGPPLAGTFLGILFSPFSLEFMSGMLVAKLALAGVTVGGRIALALAVVYLASALAIVIPLVGTIHGAFEGFIAWQRHWIAIFGPPAVMLVYGLVAAELRGGKRPWEWLISLGEVSYSVYLTHTTVGMVLIWIWIARTGGTAPRVPWLAAMFAACVAFGFMFHHAIERPLWNLTRRKKQPAVVIETTPVLERRAA